MTTEKETPAMEKHFVTFKRPGTLVSEDSARPIGSWSVEEAVAMVESMREAGDIEPIGFCFTTRGRTEDELDSRETARSGTHFLHGRIETIQEVQARELPGRESALLFNMRVNGWDRVVHNTRGFDWTSPLREGDVVLDE